MNAEMFLEVTRYRGLLGMLAWRDIRVRYKQSLLGFAWAFLMPLIQTAVFFAIFSYGPVRIDASKLGGMPYFLFLLSGVVAWGFFANSVNGSIDSLTRNSRLVTKIYFPREVFPLASVTSAMVDFAIACSLLVPVYGYYVVKGKVELTPMLLLLPVIFFIQVLLVTGIALVLSMANLFFRDVKYIMTVVLQLWFFATNVIYPLHFENLKSLRWLTTANPMIAIIDAYRNCLTGVPINNVAGLVVAVVISSLLFFFGWVTFHKAEFKFAEYV
jgi:lipopolysaccharide transport system permease protein